MIYFSFIQEDAEVDRPVESQTRQAGGDDLCHGAVQVAVPQLAPKGQSLMNIYEKSETVKSEIVKAMTRSGNVVYLPFDLRVPFAR